MEAAELAYSTLKGVNQVMVSAGREPLMGLPKGVRYDALECVIARAVADIERIMVYDGHAETRSRRMAMLLGDAWGVTPRHRGPWRWSVPLFAGGERFIENFDQGRYLGLVDLSSEPQGAAV